MTFGKRPRPNSRLSPISRQDVESKISALESRFQIARANADETDATLKNAGNYHKSLPHSPTDGSVEVAKYETLVTALNKARANGGSLEDFQAISAFSSASEPMTNPAAGLADDLLGVDPSLMPFKAAPSVKSEQTAVEMKELYWMALLRDTPFAEYAGDPTVDAAVADLNSANGAVQWLGGSVASPQTLFRGNDISGAAVGPYISQFMYQPVRFGAQQIPQRIETAVAGLDYMLDTSSFIEVQNGLWAGRANQDAIDPVQRFIRNGRDLGHYVHIDALYQAYFNAMLNLLGRGARVDGGNPYTLSIFNRTKSFATFGGPHILSLLTEVATRALKAVWYQKWFVHRRLRPEAYGGLVQFGNPNIHDSIGASAAVQTTLDRKGTKLLPMAFPEGSPTHPAYGAGHATVAGACVTLLKAWFDESLPILNPKIPNHDGTELVPYIGPGATAMTVGGELNKLAANIAIGRNFAGVHWFTDYSESIRLGERVATVMLLKQSRDYLEDFSFTYTNFDKHEVTISKGNIEVQNDPGLESFYRLHGNLFTIGGDYYLLG